VIRTFAGIVREVPARLVLIGDGPERSAAVEEARRLGVENRTVFLGKQDTVAELLGCADLFLLPSESESFGVAALEAMASGGAVVATRVGGLPEVVVEGVTGYLAPVGATEEMAHAAVRVLRDPVRAREMGRAAREVATHRFGVDVVVPQYEAYYRRVLGEAAVEEAAAG
jgi:N-acetyl-alpha-D-glucosaminyl L-malate synthase BshA